MLLDLLQSELALLSTEAKKKGAENVKEASFVVSLYGLDVETGYRRSLKPFLESVIGASSTHTPANLVFISLSSRM